MEQDLVRAIDLEPEQFVAAAVAHPQGQPVRRALGKLDGPLS
ncbi:hypothetical protein ACFOW4_24630 [Micromonospora sp. GCM10011542]